MPRVDVDATASVVPTDVAMASEVPKVYQLKVMRKDGKAETLTFPSVAARDKAAGTIQNTCKRGPSQGAAKTRSLEGVYHFVDIAYTFFKPEEGEEEPE